MKSFSEMISCRNPQLAPITRMKQVTPVAVVTPPTQLLSDPINDPLTKVALSNYSGLATPTKVALVPPTTMAPNPPIEKAIALQTTVSGPGSNI